MGNDIDTQIALLEAKVKPLLDELKALQRKRKAQIAGLRSAEIRKTKKLARDELIKKALRAQHDDLYKRNTGGLIRRLAAEFNVSERTVGALFSDLKSEID